MTKSETLQALADKLGKTRKEVSEMLEALVNLAYQETKEELMYQILFNNVYQAKGL
jgi:nucleoid DNA-binding protein